MRTLLVMSVAAVLPLLVSCTTFVPEEPPGMEVEKRIEKIRDVVDFASLQMRKKRYFYARELVLPYENHPAVGREVKLMLKEIEHQIKYRSLKKAKDLSYRNAINMVDEEMVLPEKYGKKVPLKSKLGPFEKPFGPMEELLKRKVEFKVTNADIEALLIALAEIDGVNLMADDSIAVEKTVTIHVRNVPLKEVLSYVERNMGLQFTLGENIIWVSAAEDEEVKGPKLETEIIRLKKGFIPKPVGGEGGGEGGDDAGGGNTDAKGEDDLEKVLAAFLEDNPDNPPDAKYFIYRNYNALVIRNTRENIRMAQQIIDAFDRDPLQVEIEARYVTFAESDAVDIGTSIKRLYRESERGILDADSLLTTLTTPRLEFGGIIDSFEFDIVLAALHQTGSTKTISSPRLTVLNRYTARFRNGDVRYYFDEYDAEIGDVITSDGDDDIDSNGIIIPQGQAQKLELGKTLEVTPSIGNDGKSITISLSSEIVEDLGDVNVTGSSTIKMPKTNESAIQTTVVVGSGETLILAGQIDAKETETVNQVPLLGRIPLLGWLFKRKETERDPKHLLIFLTATIIDPQGRYNTVEDPAPKAPQAAPQNP